MGRVLRVMWKGTPLSSWRAIGTEKDYGKEADRTKNTTAVDARQVRRGGHIATHSALVPVNYAASQNKDLNTTTKAEKKRIAAAAYYERKAEKKARRRKSDKPGRKMVHEEIEIPPGNLPNSSRDVERELHDAEREGSETLAGMWRLRSPEALKKSEDGHISRRALSRRDAPDPFEDWRDSQLEDSGDRSSQSDEDEEQRMRIRTISEVAGHQTSDGIRHNRDLTPPACNAPVYSKCVVSLGLLEKFLEKVWDSSFRKLNPSTSWSSPTPRPPVDHPRNGQARTEAEAPDTVVKSQPNI
ncbi:hypothetical protein B0H14DRAFT_2564079 [Mycena olivaceomarginata]|nr:hypothetical protein B0H14DRAFT_2564079 [Mycena olivaceomarginata]